MNTLSSLLTRPLCSLDVESTGTDVVLDRIVSLSITKIIPGDMCKPLQFSWLMDPGKEMSEEVVAIHGITNDQVKGLKRFGDFAGQIMNCLSGCDITGFNCDNFDVVMLHEHFSREGIDWKLDGVNIIDVGTLWKILDPRTLSAGVKKFCGREHIGAHDAANDTVETLNVLDGMLSHYSEDLAFMDITELAEKSKHEEKRVDLAGKIVLRKKDGKPSYAFGKQKGVSIEEDVNNSAPGRSFGDWILKNDFTADTKNHVNRLLGYCGDDLPFDS